MELRCLLMPFQSQDNTRKRIRVLKLAISNDLEKRIEANSKTLSKLHVVFVDGFLWFKYLDDKIYSVSIQYALLKFWRFFHLDLLVSINASYIHFLLPFYEDDNLL